MKNGSQRYDISRSRPRDEHKYSKYKSVSAWWCFYILSNTWATFEAKFTEAVVQRFSVKKVFLKISQNSEEDTCARVSFLIKLQAWDLAPAALLKNRLFLTPALYSKRDLFSCEFCEISKNTFFYGTSPMATSEVGCNECWDFGIFNFILFSLFVFNV